jgi:hypothetical protein
MITFPDLYLEDMMELPVIGTISAVVAGLLFPASWALGAIALIPCVLWILYGVTLGISNTRIRSRWARQFPRRLSCRQLRAELAAEPSWFRVHVRGFGGFDVKGLRPAAVLEDRGTGELAAVHPPGWHVWQVCEELGVELVRV